METKKLINHIDFELCRLPDIIFSFLNLLKIIPYQIKSLYSMLLCSESLYTLVYNTISLCEQVLLISLLLFLILAKKFPIIWSKFEFRVYLQLYIVVFEKIYNSSTLSTETTVQTLVNYTTRIQSVLTHYNKNQQKQWNTHIAV